MANYEGLFIKTNSPGWNDLLNSVISYAKRDLVKDEWKITEHKHVTTSYTKGAPTMEDNPAMNLSKAQVVIDGFACDENAIVLSVSEITANNPAVQTAVDLTFFSKRPHITIAVAPGIANKDSYKALEGPGFVKLTRPWVVDAVYTSFDLVKEGVLNKADVAARNIKVNEGKDDR